MFLRFVWFVLFLRKRKVFIERVLLNIFVFVKKWLFMCIFEMSVEMVDLGVIVVVEIVYIDFECYLEILFMDSGISEMDYKK